MRILHISDLHMTPNQRSKQRWLAGLADLQPDLVVNTGDNLAHQQAVPAVLRALQPLMALPGVFVFGNNDYYGPRPKNPVHYLTRTGKRIRGAPLPWADLRAAFAEHGWLDLTNTRRRFILPSADPGAVAPRKSSLCRGFSWLSKRRIAAKQSDVQRTSQDLCRIPSS